MPASPIIKAVNKLSEVLFDMRDAFIVGGNRGGGGT